MYSLAQSQYVIKIDIETQKKHIRLNVSAKAFISMTFQNPTEHTYRFRISKTIHNNSLSDPLYIYKDEQKERRTEMYLCKLFYLNSQLVSTNMVIYIYI